MKREVESRGNKRVSGSRQCGIERDEDLMHALSFMCHWQSCQSLGILLSR